MVTVEPAGPEHVPAIARLYATEALEGYATFDVEGLPEAVWEERRRSTGPGDALLVALDDDGCVLGFGWSHAYRPKPAYGSTRETTVYVDPAAAGNGVGAALYARLLELATAAGVHLVVAGVAEPNAASTRLHERLGFTPVGTMTEVGHKHGRYRDVTWWQRRLA
jgi:L-amino acid N-acyltransferase YncA